MAGIKMKKSFTLIEILLGIIIFSIVIGITLDLFVFSLKIQRKNLANQYLLDQANYVLEYISRQLRMAKRVEEPAGCISQGCTYHYESLPKKVVFLNHSEKCMEVFLDEDGQINIVKEDEFLPITSDDFEVTEFNISLMGECSGDSVQPRATISFKIKKKGFSKEFLFQTTISNRNLDL